MDLSARMKQSRRLIDLIRKELITFVRTLEDEDLFYLYQPESVLLCEGRGPQIAAIGNSHLDGSKIDLTYALKQTLYVIAAEPTGSDHFIVLITDRLSKAGIPALKKIQMLNQKDGYDCHCLVLGVGERYDTNAVQEACLKDIKSTYIHVPETALISSTLVEWIASSSL